MSLFEAIHDLMAELSGDVIGMKHNTTRNIRLNIRQNHHNINIIIPRNELGIMSLVLLRVRAAGTRT